MATGQRGLITDQQAALYTGRPVTTIRRWAHEGRITRHGKGRGQVRYDYRELHRARRDDTGRIIEPGRTPDMPKVPRSRTAA